jgi:hypothetical protein
MDEVNCSRKLNVKSNIDKHEENGVKRRDAL